MSSLRNALALTFLLLAVGVACAPQIGDQCLSSLECPEAASCDTTVPNGYCLDFDCLDISCPEGSVCVEFDTFTACMLYCRSDADCRIEEGHVCREELRPAPFCYLPESEP